MDKPDLVVACVVGDGEAESGPTATAWHAAKYVDPAESGGKKNRLMSLPFRTLCCIPLIPE